MDWLNHQGSITQRLLQEKQDAHLSVLNQTWVKEQHNDKLSFQREIVIYSHAIPQWYARTLIPQDTYQFKKDVFERLGSTPIGYYLFHNSEVARVALDYQPIDNTHACFNWLPATLKNISETFWLRKSLFTIAHNYSLTIHEIFMPYLFE